MDLRATLKGWQDVPDIHRYVDQPIVTVIRLDGPGQPDRTPRWQRGARRVDRRARRGSLRQATR